MTQISPGLSFCGYLFEVLKIKGSILWLVKYSTVLFRGSQIPHVVSSLYSEALPVFLSTMGRQVGIPLS